MSLDAFWPMIERLGDHFWWLLGVAFVVEPWFDAHIERYHRWAQSYASRQLRVRVAWTLSIAFVLIAETWAFSDEYHAHKIDLRLLRSAESEGAVDKARAEQLDASINGRNGYRERIAEAEDRLAMLNKAPLLGRDRSVFQEQLKKFYAEGGELSNRFPSEKNDADFKNDGRDFFNWFDTAGEWICSHMGVAAATKFTAVSPEQLITNLSQLRKMGRNEGGAFVLLGMVSDARGNLADLIEHDTWDPSGTPTLPPGGCEAAFVNP